MKILVTLARIIVGLLFIFSGLIKANDPLGLSYKMQEFFEIWGMSRFDSWTLWSSILMNAFEMIAGFALLLGWRIRLFSWLLLLLILFFTFLTGYTFITGKPTNCGCFGDCLPISSRTSFLKDVILTVLIGFLCWQQRLIRPVFSKWPTAIAMLLVTIFSFGIQWYSLTWLPPVDCLPFKKGNNIPAKMKSPPGSVPDSFAIRFVYEKEGKRYEFSATDLPADLGSYNYISRTDKLVRKGNAEPPIKGFALMTNDNADLTDSILHSHQSNILVFTTGLADSQPNWLPDFKVLVQSAQERNIPLYMVTSNYVNVENWLNKNSLTGIRILKCDNTAIRTAARTNPCIYLIARGTVIDKQSYKRIDQITAKLGLTGKR